MRAVAKLLLLNTILASILIASASAFETPRIIPHSGPVNKPVPEVFQTLKSYFSDQLESKFVLVSADEKTGTIVAKQTGIDSARWTNWAACTTDALHMLYKLSDAAVTLTVKLDQAPHNTTFMTVTADFQGTYALAQDQTTIACQSTGVLEDNILAFAGAQTGGSPPSPAP